jgi:NitT/TauT family transport system ATP-binding protein
MLTRLSIDDLQIVFAGETTATLDQINLNVRPGEFVAIVGPSGCGKSTLLRIIAGLLKPTTGSIHAAADSPEDAVRFGFVFQHPTLLPWRTAAGNLMLPFELERKDRSREANPESVIAESLKLVGLSEADAGKRPAQLSGGMQMRLSLARALILEPDVLLLDEPFAAVDDLLRLQLQEDLRVIHESRSLTSILVTHNLLEAVFMSDRVVVLGGSPAGISAEVPISIERPRQADLRNSDVFHHYVEQLTRVVFGDLQAARIRATDSGITDGADLPGDAL